MHSRDDIILPLLQVPMAVVGRQAMDVSSTNYKTMSWTCPTYILKVENFFPNSLMS